MNFLIKYFISLLITIIVASAENTFSNKRDDRINIVSSNNKNTVKKASINVTYFEQPDNVMRFPYTGTHLDKNEKKLKKMPKRTIQKIIKKNRRVRKLYINQISSPKPEQLKYLQKTKEDISAIKEPNKGKKYSMSISKYGMPYQKSFNMRNKRNIPRNDLFILKDLDEIEFLGDSKDYDVIKAHIKSYW